MRSDAADEPLQLHLSRITSNLDFDMLRTTATAATLLFAAAAPASAAVIAGNGNTQFGGAVGTGSLDVSFNDQSGEIDITFTRGSGNLDDALVLYLDSRSGGFADTATLADTGDPGRSAISGFSGTNRSVVNFAPGFEADFAVAIDAGFSGVFELTQPSFGFVTGTGNSGNSQPTYTVSIPTLALGLTTGDTLSVVGTYLNAGNSFRADEAFGDGVPAGNPGFNSITFSNSLSIVIPEPASLGLLAAAAPLMLRRRSR